MVTRDGALQLARAWFSSAGSRADDVELCIHEFELGYVIWQKPPVWPPGTVPTEVGGTMLVVDRTTGDITTWPLLPAEYVAQQYGLTQQAKKRFPADVYEDVTTPGGIRVAT